MTYAAANEAVAENWQRFLLVLLSLTLSSASACQVVEERDRRESQCLKEAAVHVVVTEDRDWLGSG